MKAEVISQAGTVAIKITFMFQGDCESNATQGDRAEGIFQGTRD